MGRMKVAKKCVVRKKRQRWSQKGGWMHWDASPLSYSVLQGGCGMMKLGEFLPPARLDVVPSYAMDGTVSVGGRALDNTPLRTFVHRPHAGHSMH